MGKRTGRPKLPPNTPCKHGHNEGRNKFGRCRICANQWAQAWMDANPERKRAARVANDKVQAKKLSAQNKMWKSENRLAARSPYHGLTFGEVRARLAAQGGRCAICGGTEPVVKRWHGDHDHVTGHFRAVLCHQCNCGIGMLADDQKRVQAAADYLTRHAQLHAMF